MEALRRGRRRKGPVGRSRSRARRRRRRASARRRQAGPRAGAEGQAMKRARQLLGVAAVALGALAGGPARADTPPSIWDRAKDPSLSESYRVHVEVQRRLAQKDRFDVGDSQVRTVRALLERYNAAKSKDPRLRFDLGLVYLRLEEYDKSAKVLGSVLAEFPDHPAAEDGWLRLAFACGHTGDHACERRAYTEVLRQATDELSRATPTLNLAET